MTKRTTVLIDDEVYEKLVQESVKKYGSTKAISKVLNERLRGTISGERKIVELIRSKRIARTTAKEFEQFRKRLSSRLEG